MAAPYTLVIGDKNFSSWSLRPWLAMKVAGIPFDEVAVRLYQLDTTATIRAHSGAGRVPVLKFAENGETRTVWDSLAICETLAERHPQARLWPADAASRSHARSITAEMHSGFPDVRRQLSMDITARHPTPELEKATRDQVDRIVAIWTDALSRHHDGGFLFGHFSIADAFYAPVVTRFATYSVPLPAAAADYCQFVNALPAMREWTEAAHAEAASN
jgi:glutathione S-transferase